MSGKDEGDEVVRLQQVNNELSDSLRRCRRMLHDYQATIAANSNEHPWSGNDEQNEG